MKVSTLTITIVHEDDLVVNQDEVVETVLEQFSDEDLVMAAVQEFKTTDLGPSKTKEIIDWAEEANSILSTKIH